VNLKIAKSTLLCVFCAVCSNHLIDMFFSEKNEWVALSLCNFNKLKIETSSAFHKVVG